jgi:hypothetical protein
MWLTMGDCIDQLISDKVVIERLNSSVCDKDRTEELCCAFLTWKSLMNKIKPLVPSPLYPVDYRS